MESNENLNVMSQDTKITRKDQLIKGSRLNRMCGYEGSQNFIILDIQEDIPSNRLLPSYENAIVIQESTGNVEHVTTNTLTDGNWKKIGECDEDLVANLDQLTYDYFTMIQRSMELPPDETLTYKNAAEGIQKLINEKIVEELYS